MAIKVASYSQIEDMMSITKAIKPITPIPMMKGTISWTLKAQITISSAIINTTQVPVSLKQNSEVFILIA